MKKIVSTIIVFAMLLTQFCVLSVSANNDYTGHWAEEYITKLVEQNIVSGDENGNINPDNNITRAEFVKIINKKFNYTTKSTDNFPDVSSDKWYAEEFKIAKKQGYLKGDEKGNANPDSFITRAEVSVIIARVLDLKDDYSKATKFTDDNDIPTWAKESIYRLNVKGYINGYPDGSFKAQNTITRAESFTIVSKIAVSTSTSSTPSGGYNKDRTIEELTELNGNQLPEIEMNEDGSIGLYSGVYSEMKVEDVNDAIDSLENVKTILNIENVSEEFIPFDDEGSTIDDGVYKIQQVYNGVPVANAQTIIGTDENGYPNSILNRYDDSIRLADINTIPSITEQQTKEIIINDLSAKNTDYANISIDSVYLEILPEEKWLVYSGFATCDNSLGWNYSVDAHSGEVKSLNEKHFSFEHNLPNSLSDYVLDFQGKQITISLEKENDKLLFYDKKHNNLIWYADGKQLSPYKINSSMEDFDLLSYYAFQTIYNMGKTVDCYENLLNYYCPNDLSALITDQIDEGNATYSYTYTDSDNLIILLLSPTASVKLDTVGHEHTHYFQNYYCDKRFEKGLSDGFTVQNSSNLQWVEAMAISEGTADIMGMLIESLTGEVIFNSNDFWHMNEDESNGGGWSHLNPSYSDGVHTTVSEMNSYYKNKPHQKTTGIDPLGNVVEYYLDEIPYPFGPGHSDRYILPKSFKYMIEDSPHTSHELWFKLWGNAIKMLTPASGFDDMRLALLDSASRIGINLSAVKYGLDQVGITGQGTLENSEWYIPYINKAFDDGLITESRPYDGVTRAEFLTMVLRKEGLSADGVSSYVEHWAGHNVTWAYAMGILPSSWLDVDYLNGTMERWEATTVLFKVLNYKQAQEIENNHVYRYKYTLDLRHRFGFDEPDNINAFDEFGIPINGYDDYGINVTLTANRIKQLQTLLNYHNPEKISADGIIGEKTKRAIKIFQETNLDYTYLTDGYGTFNEETINALYYFGMFNLKIAGKFDGVSLMGGLTYLHPFLGVSRAETVAMLYK